MPAGISADEGPGSLRPIALDDLTAVEDAAFRAVPAAEGNLPDNYGTQLVGLLG